MERYAKLKALLPDFDNWDSNSGKMKGGQPRKLFKFNEGISKNRPNMRVVKTYPLAVSPVFRRQLPHVLKNDYSEERRQRTSLLEHC
jgi:hypothetical protein